MASILISEGAPPYLVRFPPMIVNAFWGPQLCMQLDIFLGGTLYLEP